jgi:hypothetical protein
MEVIMSVKVIGAGWGRTATNSLKLALEQLDYGVCHHMWEVGHAPDRLVPLWNAALDGQPDWPAIFEGNRSAVDWPVAAFWSELADYYPEAKIILTTRSAESWSASISNTILQVIGDPEQAPEPVRPMVRMAQRVVTKSIGEDWSTEALKQRFLEHEQDVKSNLAPERLLVFAPSEGWEPLCDFLGKTVPDEPFPQTNHRAEFFANMEELS